MDTANLELLQDAVMRLKSIGINFLALDFDYTLIDISTAEKSKRQNSEVIAKSIRPVFQEMVPLIMEHGIHIGIVSFNRNLELIHEVLGKGFPNHYQKIVVRANYQCKDWIPPPKLDSKNQFIASAVADQNNPLITRATTLLIDDDFNNIDNALTHNIRALHFDPTNPHLIIADILELI